MDFSNPGLIFIGIAAISVLLIFIRTTTVRFNDPEQMRAYTRKIIIPRIWYLISRTLIITLITIAIMGPYTTQTTMINDEPRAVIITDTSASMLNTPYDSTPLLAALEDIHIETYEIRESLYEEIRPRLRENTPLVIITDGLLHGEALRIAQRASSINATLNFIIPERLAPDIGIEIISPEFTTALVDTPITVRIRGDDLPYNLTLRVDDEVVLERSGIGTSEHSITITPGQGYRIVRATIDTRDAYQNNNDDVRILTVSEKPTISLITDNAASPLTRTLQGLYNVRIGQNIEGSAVVIDNQPSSRIDVDALSEHLLEGAGAVIIGGDRSYDRGNYKNSRIEQILPVTIGDAERGDDGSVNVILVLDISGSVGNIFAQGRQTTMEEVIKNYAISTLRSLKPTDNVGVIAFNTQPYDIAPLAQAASHSGLEERILRLESFGGTWIHTGMSAAIQELAQLSGTRYILLFSDFDSQTPERDMDAAISMRNAAITLHTVGIGESMSQDDLNHMRSLARVTGGSHFQPGEQDKIRIIFGTSETESDGVSGTSRLTAWDRDHFISTGLRLESFITGYNTVLPKPTGRVLVVTNENRPIVVSGFFGLGRIVTVATDAGQSWSGNIYERDPQLIARIVNYAIGNAAKQQNLHVTANLQQGTSIVDITSKEQLPERAQFNDQDILIEQIGPDEYRTTITAPRGIHTLLGQPISVRADHEFLYPDITARQVALATGGNIYRGEEIDEIVTKIRSDSVREENIYESLSRYFLLAAAIIFLVEIFIRRLREDRSDTP